MFFRVLGPLEAEVRGRPATLGGPKPRLLLAALLLEPNSVVSADALTDVLWPGQVPRSAGANLRTYVHGLRRLLGGRIEGRPGGYLLHVAPDELDATLAGQLVARAHEEHAPALLDEAAALWRGEVLEDLPHHHSWSPAVARLTELRLSVQEERLRSRVEAGRHADAIVELRGLLAEHPLREELWRLLVVALGASGRPGEALAAYAEAERALRTELDTDPGERLRQALVETAPAAPVCQLPLDLPDFTGRQDQLTDLAGVLDGSRTAVVALSGPAGAGKSALALRAAHAARDRYPDGQLYVDLRGTSESPRRPLEVLPELLHALGVPDAGIPRGLDERSALLRSRLAGRRVCLVLDDAGSAAQVRPLLPGAGACAVLVTSRGRLPDLIAARHVDVGMLPEAEATELLARIVGAARAAAEPDAAAAIVRACGRLPLAIRVAGARLSHRREWTLRTLADRLADERRRLDELRVGDLAVRAGLALSYEQLPVSCARAFRALGTLGPLPFPGWVAGALLGRSGADDVLEVLAGAHLVDVVDGQPRYRLHDLVRCYARELADSDPYDERRARVRRVLEGYLALADEGRAADAGALLRRGTATAAAGPAVPGHRARRTGRLVRRGTAGGARGTRRPLAPRFPGLSARDGVHPVLRPARPPRRLAPHARTGAGRGGARWRPARAGDRAAQPRAARRLPGRLRRRASRVRAFAGAVPPHRRRSGRGRGAGRPEHDPARVG
ncbi:AfsR/SARP family transcriptional regulator [Amycolatopsis thermophila]|uniref:DNA-binding SARP family transcriptional activator n=1 Tax=Amycolatopsis thermophila TaxID=206084 RepID=A0ABU0EW64_9PSEU|nr:DNA-binding SARP family transcriptional activator [Amycolatopsis thermophila]